MRTLFIIPLVLMSLVSFPSWGSSFTGLVERDGLYFKKFSDIPYTGQYLGPLKLETGSFVNGKPHGLWVSYYLNGQLKMRENYNDGNLNLREVFKQDGSLIRTETWKDGVKVSD